MNPGQAQSLQCELKRSLLPSSVNPGQAYTSQCEPRPSLLLSTCTQAKNIPLNVDPGQAHSSQHGPKPSALPSVQRVGKWFTYSPPAQGHPHLLAPAGVCPESLAQCFTKRSLRAQEPITDVERLVGGQAGCWEGQEPELGWESPWGAGPLKPTPRFESSLLDNSYSLGL